MPDRVSERAEYVVFARGEVAPGCICFSAGSGMIQGPSRDPRPSVGALHAVTRWLDRFGVS